MCLEETRTPTQPPGTAKCLPKRDSLNLCPTEHQTHQLAAAESSHGIIGLEKISPKSSSTRETTSQQGKEAHGLMRLVHVVRSALGACEESQNHRTIEVGRNLCRSSGLMLLLKQDHLKQVAQGICPEDISSSQEGFKFPLKLLTLIIFTETHPTLLIVILP